MINTVKRERLDHELISKIEQIFSNTNKNFNMKFWNGESIKYSDKADFTLSFNDREEFNRLLMHPDIIAFAEAYMNKSFDIEGDIFSAIQLKEELENLEVSGKDKVSIFLKTASLPKLNMHTKEKDKENISHHYDISNDFYRLFLGPSMVYSCAYFRDENEDITTAEENKLDHICRKLRLKAGEKFLDVGCGWGSMIIWAAKHYGVEAHGVTISEEQYKYVCDRIKKEGIQDKCFVELKDYRDIEGNEVYDKIVSIGMFEHVGTKNLPEYFKIMNRLLKSDGLFLNHGITKSKNYKVAKDESEFIEKYIFPGGELNSISYVQDIMEQENFEVYDVECLREHYFKTLRCWVNNLQANKDMAIKAASELVYRTWLLYMTGCALNFKGGSISVYQVLLGKEQKMSGFNIPLTREYMYKDI
ncbi:class I SAM-dependent methyltransferase [Clostridium sp. P21]|uniref:Class I SAM-dependent methyltransferase n=1 Tax=Clostridium muellerianum TaxID=2716538 RepID=A0A7Y0EEA7_9CLOT|nr:cyclopropane-fatty-acyl-phospholipid synthase family protein [Clostridium muellerianum]NMM61931.1 class I SAM-dependent methyltransferase [Clostridium muellerianum]